MTFLFRLMRPTLGAAMLLIALTRGLAQDEPGQSIGINDLLKNSGKLPKPIQQKRPVYPHQMAQAGLIGSVTVGFIIDKEGNVQNPYVVQSNNPWFERPAIDAILGWKFQPAEVNGRPVNTRVLQLLEFAMEPEGRLPWLLTKGKDHAKLPPDFQWDTPPAPVNTMFPVYPFEQLRAHVGGKAKITYIVGPSGRVISSKLNETTTPEFGLAVRAMVDAWRFQPGKKKDGRPACAILHTEYEFRADGLGDVPVTDEAKGILRDLAKKPERISSLKDLDSPLRARSQRPPDYPTAFAEAGQPGTALIEFFVDKNGDAQLPRIVSSSAPEFGYAAALAVATWRFHPPLVKKKPTVVRVQIPIEFEQQKPRPGDIARP